MPKHSLKTLVAAAILGLCSATITDLRAGDQAPVGVVRISDQGTTNSGSTMAPAPENGYGQSCDGCNDCQQGSSCYCPLCAMMHRDGVTYSPDHGFRRPVVEHIQRIPVEYRRYWPAKWYGEPGSGLATGYPMVYTPTDTTQLGFYYQRVPQWQPKPGMIPPRPWPSQWHRREVCNNCNNGNIGVQENGISQPQPAPAEPAPATIPQEQTPAIPPTPPAESAGPQAAFELPPAVEGTEAIETTGG